MWDTSLCHAVGAQPKEIAKRSEWKRQTEVQTSSVFFLVWDCESSALWKPLTCPGMNLDRYQMSAILLLRRKQIQFSCSYRKFIQTLTGHEDNTNNQGKKILPNGEWYGGLSIGHENQNIFLKWTKEETKDESAYALNLISEFSCKLHCKAGILASKYDAECPCFRKLWDLLWVNLRHCFSLSNLGFCICL